MIWLRCIGIFGGMWVVINELHLWGCYLRDRWAWRAENRKQS